MIILTLFYMAKFKDTLTSSAVTQLLIWRANITWLTVEVIPDKIKPVLKVKTTNAPQL